MARKKPPPQVADVRQLRPVAGRVPPNDLTAEAAVLSACMLSRVALDDVRPMLEPEAFYADSNSRIYAAILWLADHDQPTDTVTVASHLRQLGLLEQVGGVAYIAQLCDATPAVAHVRAHAAVVVDRWRTRTLIARCQATVALGYDAPPVGELLAEHRSALDAVDARATGGIELLDAASIYAPLPEAEWLVDGLLQKPGLMLLAGYGSSAKTWAALDMLCAVGCGDAWLSHLKCKRGRAAFLDYESGARETRRRLQQLSYGRSFDIIDGISVAPLPSVYLSDAAFESAIARLAESVDLLVIDSLRAACPDIESENDSSIRIPLDRLRRIGEKRGCSVVVLVHAKKSQAGTVAKQTQDLREVIRGNSAIFDAADTVVLSVWDHERRCAQLIQTKARHHREIDPFCVRIVDGEDAHGSRTTRLEYIVPANEPDASEHESLDTVIAQIRSAIRRRPDMGTRALREEVKAKAGRIAAALEWLMNRGEVVNHGTASAHRYRLHSAANGASEGAS